MDAVPTIFEYNSKVPPKKARRVHKISPSLSTSVQSSHDLPFTYVDSSDNSDTDTAPETVEYEMKLRSKGIQVNR